MKTFPVKITYREDENHRQNELIRAEIKFVAEVRVDKKYLPQMEKSAKNGLAERLQRQIYGDIKHALVTAETEIRMLREIDPYKISRIFDNLRNSIPKLTHENNP